MDGMRTSEEGAGGDGAGGARDGAVAGRRADRDARGASAGPDGPWRDAPGSGRAASRAASAIAAPGAARRAGVRPGPGAVILARLSSARFPLIAAGVVAILALSGGAPVLFVLLGFSAIVAAAAIGPRRSRAQRLAERASTLRRSRRRTVPSHVEIVEALPDPAILLDATRVILHQNGAATRLFGPTPPGTPVGLKFRTPELRETIATAVETRRPARLDPFETTGGERVFEVHAVPIVPGTGPQMAGRDGAPGLAHPHYLLVFRDRTEARRQARVRSAFLANASHELRTPLASLIGYIETLQGPAREDVEARGRFLGIMAQQAERMQRLVDDLMSLSRAERRVRLPARERIDLTLAVGHAVDTARPLLEAREVRLDWDPPGPVHVAGDGDELTGVVSNLIENALHYGTRGTREGDARVLVAVDTLPGDRVAVRVRDWGAGIEAMHLPRLTERFYRVDAEASRARRGTGLGLAIVKHVLMRHGTRLEVKSRPGEGAEFSFSLPRWD